MPTASKERRKSEIIVEQKLEHAVATQTDRLLQGQVECGDLRASNHTAVNRFRKAANKVVVTNEVMHMLVACQQELRQAQQEYHNSQGRDAAAGPQQEAPAPARPSIKARQLAAVAAADAAATYSLRSAGRGRVSVAAAAGGGGGGGAAAAAAAAGASAALSAGSAGGAPPDVTGARGGGKGRLDPAAAAGVQAQDTPAAPSDWGFLKNVDRLVAAPAAVARRVGFGSAPLPEQPYDAAAKGAQASQQAGWRHVLSAKKHRQANKTQLEDAEREQAAKFIQANWLLHKYRKDKRLAEEQDLTDWAEKHYAAAMAGRRSMTVNLNNTRSTVPAESESEPDSESISGLSASQTSGELSPQSSRRRSKGAASDVAEKSSKPVVQPWTRMVGREAPVNTTNTNAITSNSKWRGAVAGAVAVNKLAAGHVFDLEFAAEGSSSSVHAAASASAAVPLLPGQHVAALEDTNMGTSPLFRTGSIVPGTGLQRTASALASVMGAIAGVFRTKSSSGGSSTSSSARKTGSSSGGGASANHPAAAKIGTRLSMDFAAFFGAASSKVHKDGSSDVHKAGSNSSIPSVLTPSVSGTTHAPTPPLTHRRSMEFVSAFFRPSLDCATPHQQRQQSHAAQAHDNSSEHFTGLASNGVGAAGSAVPLAAPHLPSHLRPAGVTVSHDHVNPEQSQGEPFTPRTSALNARGAAAAALYLEAASRAMTERESAPVPMASHGSGLIGMTQVQATTLSRLHHSSADHPASARLPGDDVGAAGLSDAAEAAAGGTPAAAGTHQLMQSSTTQDSTQELSCGCAPLVQQLGNEVGDPNASDDSSLNGIWSKISQGPGGASSGATDTQADGSELQLGLQALSQQQQQPSQQQQQQQQPAQQNAADSASAAEDVMAGAISGPSSKSTSSTGNTSNPGKQLEPRPPSKPRAVGKGDVHFQPHRPALRTAADVSSSSLFKPTQVSKAHQAAASKPLTPPAPSGKPAPLTTKDAQDSNNSSSSSLSRPQAAVSVSNVYSTSFFQPTVPTTSAVAAVMQEAAVPSVPAPAPPQRRLPAKSVSRINLSGPPASMSPLSPTTSGSISSVLARSSSGAGLVRFSSDESAAHVHFPSGEASSPTSPLSPARSRSNSLSQSRMRNSSFSSKSPVLGLLARQMGQKSMHMSIDAAAALALEGGPSSPGNRSLGHGSISFDLEVATAISSAAKTAAAAAAASTSSEGKAGHHTAAARLESASISSISQKLAIARRLAATAAVDDEQDDDEDSWPEGALNVQLDGSASRAQSANSKTGSHAAGRNPSSSSTGRILASFPKKPGQAPHTFGTPLQKPASNVGSQPLRSSIAAAGGLGPRTAWTQDIDNGSKPSAELARSTQAPTSAALGASHGNSSLSPSLKSKAPTANPGQALSKSTRTSPTSSLCFPVVKGSKRAGDAAVEHRDGRSDEATPRHARRNSFSNDGSKPYSNLAGPQLSSREGSGVGESWAGSASSMGHRGGQMSSARDRAARLSAL